MTREKTSLTLLTAVLALSACYTSLRTSPRTDAASPDTSRVDAPSTGGPIDTLASTGGRGGSVDASGSGGVGVDALVTGNNDSSGSGGTLGSGDVGVDAPVTGSNDSSGNGGTSSSGDVGIDAPTTGSGGALDSGGSGGDASTSISGHGGSGGSVVTGGVVGSGGTVATGGVLGSGGTVVTGGVVGFGGMTGAGGATCQPKSRDCTSSLDNDCNGTPDNQETAYCTCLVGKSQPCQQHPGYDGAGICKAGSQTCSASSDKTTSGWGPCSGSVGPSTRNCTSSVDSDCNGTPDNQETAYCQCPAGTNQSCLPAGMCKAGSQTCATSSDKTATGWGPCTGYTGPSTMYRDADGDGYGNPAQAAQVCPLTAGYVNNGDDCDDSNSAFYPGISACASDYVTRKWCVAGGGGVTKTEPCGNGCMSGICRPASDGMIGVPGYVSCTNSPRCSTADGCQMDDPSGGCGTAGGSAAVSIYCDGPNDCPGQKCLFYRTQGFNESSCYATQQPDGSSYVEVCDPLASTCTPPLTCVKDGRYTLYLCQ